MVIGYKNDIIKKKLGTDEGLLKAFRDKAITVLKRLEEITVTRNLNDLRAIPFFKCRPLTNKETGQWIIYISPGYSLIFEIDHNPLPLLNDGTIDYSSINCIMIIGTIHH